MFWRRKTKRLIGYRAKRPMNYVVFQPVHQRLAKDPRVAVRFYGKLHGQGNARALYEQAGAGPVHMMHNLVARYFPFDLYMSADFSIDARFARRKAHMFHGLSFKNHAVSPRARDFDAVFLVGPYMERRFIERGVFEAGDPRMRQVGMPKLDCLLDGSLDREAILDELGCRPDRPTVLYAPTWGSTSSMRAMGQDVIRNLCGCGLNLLVKLHDNLYDPRKNEVRWADRLAELAHLDLTVVRSRNVVPLQFVADVLISDASSVAYEYLLLDRPILFLAFPGQFEKVKHRADLETWGRKVGMTVDDAGGIATAVESALSDPSRQHETRRQAAQDLFFNPGRATERAVAEVYRLLELDPPPADEAV